MTLQRKKAKKCEKPKTYDATDIVELFSWNQTNHKKKLKLIDAYCTLCQLYVDHQYSNLKLLKSVLYKTQQVKL